MPTRFDTGKHPSFLFGEVAIPAFTLPVLGCLIFINAKIFYRPHRRQASNSKDNAKAPTSDPEKQLCTEHNVATRTLEDRLFGRAWYIRYLPAALSFYHQFCLTTTLSMGQGSRPSVLLCASQAVSLLLEGFYVENDRLVACALTAAGWLALLVQQCFHSFLGSKVGFVLVLLALPVLIPSPNLGVVTFGSYVSGTILIRVALDSYIPPDSTIRYPKLGTTEAWPFMILGTSLLLSSIRQSFEETKSTQQSTVDHLSRLLRKLISVELPEVLQCLMRAAAVISPLALFFFVGMYLSSCLGWNYIILGTAATTPSLEDGAILGGIFYFLFWTGAVMLQKSKAWPNRKALALFWDMLMVSANALGWMNFTMVGLWVVASNLPNRSMARTCCCEEVLYIV